MIDTPTLPSSLTVLADLASRLTGGHDHHTELTLSPSEEPDCQVCLRWVAINELDVEAPSECHTLHFADAALAEAWLVRFVDQRTAFERKVAAHLAEHPILPRPRPPGWTIHQLQNATKKLAEALDRFDQERLRARDALGAVQPTKVFLHEAVEGEDCRYPLEPRHFAY